MPALLAASLIWAFSFGLIKTQLAGIPPHLVALLRLLLSALLFAPWFRPRRIDRRLLALLVAIGAVQYGVMYLAYLASFAHLQASEVALWTIFTPVYVAVLADAAAGAFRRRTLTAAGLSVLAAWLVSPNATGVALVGVGLVQVSNLCFAVGQVWYRRVLPVTSDIRDRDIFAALYLGGTLLAAVPVGMGTGMLAVLTTLSGIQVATILYLGLIPSGVAFFLWNAGARRTRDGAVAVLNNLKVPLAIVVSWVIFEAPPSGAHLARTLLALALIGAALGIADPRPARPPTRPLPVSS
jgi:drug/metabolite transporter (DMT)-like permease